MSDTNSKDSLKLPDFLVPSEAIQMLRDLVLLSGPYTEFSVGRGMLGVPKALSSYKCPHCGESFPDTYDGYEIAGDHYPKIFNERQGSTMDGSYHNWDEMHCCPECHTIYYFNNGAY